MIWKYSLSTVQEQAFQTLFRHIAEPNNAKIVSIHNFAVPIIAKIFSNFPKSLYAYLLIKYLKSRRSLHHLSSFYFYECQELLNVNTFLTSWRVKLSS